MVEQADPSRRRFLHAATVTGVLAVSAAGPLALGQERKEQEEQITPTEDLMREHGVLRRVMLVYDEIVRRMQAKQEFPPQALSDAAGIIRQFVEDYHEKLEENQIFPRFEKANQMVDLVRILRTQHDAGRKVTDVVLHHAAAIQAPDAQAAVIHAIDQFNRMYAPHAAREDTVLFPAFHGLVSPKEMDTLGDEFEKQEQQLFGQDGFEKMVAKVAGIEKTLGIYDLAQFTPKT